MRACKMLAPTAAALHLACQHGRLACVRVLLEAGAGTRVADGRGRTALELAAAAGHAAVQDMLREHEQLLLEMEQQEAEEAAAVAVVVAATEDVAAGGAAVSGEEQDEPAAADPQRPAAASGGARGEARQLSTGGAQPAPSSLLDDAAV